MDQAVDGHLANRTFPDCQDAPTSFQEGSEDLTVTVTVSRQLGRPKIRSGSWNPEVRATFMGVPEAPMDKNNCAVLSKDEVGTPGKIPAMKTEPITSAVQPVTNNEFGLGILCADLGHHNRPRHHWMLLSQWTSLFGGWRGLGG